MKPITVNLATRPFLNNRVLAAVLGTAAALVILATTYNVWTVLGYGGTYAAIQGAERADRARLQALETEERGLAREIAARDFRTVYERGQFANEMILRRAFSWTLLFNTLEAVVPPEVMMSAIRPTISGDGIQIRVEGLAKSADALYGFQGRLFGNPTFANVRPISERKLNPGRPDVTFALGFDYLPKRAAPPARAVTASAPMAPPAGAPVAAGPAPAAASAQGVIATAPPRGTVGRDGRPQDAAVPARIVAAPGAVRLPAGMALPAGAAAGGRPAGRSDAPQRGAGRPVSAAPGPGTALAAERVAQTGAGGSGSVPEPPALEGPAIAVRLDVPLRFANRPAREAYAALSRAHGAQFTLDAAVDGDARISADLAGRPLPEAIATLARAAGHRVVRLSEGRYRVALGAGGEALADKPVREENLGSQEGAP